MAEEQENKNSKGIGELFVEFGTKGFPTILKQLNNISASFLIGKKAAEQFTKPFKQMGNTAIDIGLVANSLDTTLENVMKLQNHLKKHGLSESLIGNIAEFRKLWVEMKGGRIPTPDGWAQAFGNLSLDMQSYGTSLEEIYRLFDDIDKASKGDRTWRNTNLGLLNLPDELGYLWDRGGKISDAQSISDAEIEQQIKARESLNELGIAFKTLTDTILVKLTPILIEWAEILENWILNYKDSGLAKTIEQGKKVVDNYKKADEAWKTQYSPQAGARKLQDKLNYHPDRQPVSPKDVQPKPNQKDIPWWIQLTDFGQYNTGNMTGGAASIVPDFMDVSNGYVPSGVSNINNANITINNENHINGNDSQQILHTITSIDTASASLQAFAAANPGQM